MKEFIVRCDVCKRRKDENIEFAPVTISIPVLPDILKPYRIHYQDDDVDATTIRWDDVCCNCRARLAKGLAALISKLWKEVE